MKIIKIILILISVAAISLSCNYNAHNKNQSPIKIDVTKKSANTLGREKKGEKRVIEVAISTMISPKRTFYLYENLLNYIQKKLGVPLKLKQRKTYQEVNDLLEDGKLDFAYVCSGAYVVAKRKFPLKILAAPVINGKTFYQAYIIVNKASGIKTFAELRGKSFAFSDPISNTGYKFVVKLLKDQGTTPKEFFDKTIFTYAHDYSIQTVERNLIDGATVDGLVYDYLKVNDPDRLKDIKIIYKSPEYGIPPFVYAPNTDMKLIKKIRKILLTMNKNKEGEKILKQLQIEKFVQVNPDIYNSLKSFN